MGRYTTPTIIVLRSLIWISKNTDSITRGMNTDRSSRFTFVNLLILKDIQSGILKTSVRPMMSNKKPREDKLHINSEMQSQFALLLRQLR